MPNQIKLSLFRVEQSTGSVKIDDLYPLKFLWSIPPVKYFCGGAISELEKGEYRIGFIQFITHYKLVMDYKDTRVVVAVPTPISDSGGTSGKDQPEVVQKDFEKGDGQGNVYDMDSIFPWYEPPLVFKGPYTPPPRERKYFTLRGGDAPYGSAVWVWPLQRPPQKAIKEADDYLKRIERVHNFVTCVVLWDHKKSQIAQLLGKAEWTHKLLIEADAIGTSPKLKARLEDPDPKVTTSVPDDFAIPPSCLRAPCANGISGSCLRVETKTPTGIAATRTQSIHVRAGDTRKFKWEVEEVPRVRLSQTGIS